MSGVILGYEWCYTGEWVELYWCIGGVILGYRGCDTGVWVVLYWGMGSVTRVVRVAEVKK